MIALFLLLVIAAIVLGIFGVVVKGLLYLLFIGIAVLLGALLLAALRMRRRPGRARQGDSPPGLPGACAGRDQQIRSAASTRATDSGPSFRYRSHAAGSSVPSTAASAISVSRWLPLRA